MKDIQWAAWVLMLLTGAGLKSVGMNEGGSFVLGMASGFGVAILMAKAGA